MFMLLMLWVRPLLLGAASEPLCTAATPWFCSRGSTMVTPDAQDVHKKPLHTLEMVEPSGRNSLFEFFDDVLVSPHSAVAAACAQHPHWAPEACMQVVLPHVESHFTATPALISPASTSAPTPASASAVPEAVPAAPTASKQMRPPAPTPEHVCTRTHAHPHQHHTNHAGIHVRMHAFLFVSMHVRVHA